MAAETEQHDERADQIRDYIDRIPPLSNTVTKVLEVCNRPNTSANDLNKIISLDPVLTGRVLRLINSSFYSLPEQVSSLTRAIIMLGINTVKNLALSTAVARTVNAMQSQQILPSDQFWTHSMTVGLTAKALAARTGVADNAHDDFFVAGLLQDLGKMPLLQCFAADYASALQTAREQQIPLYRAEEQMFGFHHGGVGKEIGERWKLSSAICECMGRHHDASKAPRELQGAVATVALANSFACHESIGSAGDSFPDSTQMAQALEFLKLVPADMEQLKQTVQPELEKAQAFIKVL